MPGASRAGELERRQLAGTFVELCRIQSPSRRERACAEHVAAELRSLGLEVEEDGAAAVLGGDCGNLLARIPAAADTATAAPALALCAHLDTVPPQAPVEPELVDGGWENANDGILGADNKAAVAVLLALARRFARERPPLELELLFTVAEEVSLAGARAFDAGRLRAGFGYVFDHATPIGGIVVGSPTHFRIGASFRGAAAHAGIRPEQGRSAILAACRAVAAMPLGRLDGDTTANVGTIAGGSAINVVAERCELTAEVRSLRDARAEEVVAATVDALEAAANLPECDCDLDISVERTFGGYSLPRTAAPVTLAERALRACGYEPVHITSGGGSDANALIAQGFQTVNLANGTERNHEPGERVGADALEGMLDVALTLVEQAAALPSGTAV